MINYAHRGASEYAPENTLSSFYLGLLQGADGIETDVQRTRDGELVLFHDDTLERVSDHAGSLRDYTLDELRAVKVYGNSTTGFYDRIVTYREFLEKFAAYDLRFAIELKGPDTEEAALVLSREFGIMERTTFTSFSFDRIEKMKTLCPTARVGWLVHQPSQKDVERLLTIGGEEIAPEAAYITVEQVALWRRQGLGVRAWGVDTTELMKKMCTLGVDGMTVNFPDRLTQYLHTK